MSDYILVRVAREVIDELLDHPSKPVVLVQAIEVGDGTHELVFRNPTEEEWA